MQLTGYSDVWSVRAGEEISFHVHCALPHYEAGLVRLIHGDENPKGPGRKQLRVPSSLDGRHEGVSQSINKGSFGIANIGDVGEAKDTLTVSVWVWPTLPGPQIQGIVSWQKEPDHCGFGIFLAADGHVECRRGSTTLLRSSKPLSCRQWYEIRVDLHPAELDLQIRAARWSPLYNRPSTGKALLKRPIDLPSHSQILIAAGWTCSTAQGAAGRAIFNGKIARPRLIASGQVLAAWDFFMKSATNDIVDTSGRGRHGRLVNRPSRLMTGPGWPGDASSTAAAPDTHDAVHFHDDDVADVGWSKSLTLPVPGDLPSGVYALELRSDELVDHLPFILCPPRTGTRPRLAVLMPTMSYLAYANESLDVSATVQLSPRQDMSIAEASYEYVALNGLKSTYDRHRDGSPILYGSRRRPIIDFRPDARCRTFDAPHQFAADLHLIDWLTEKGYEFDVITDDLLHAEGPTLLQPYRTVISGSHPEYWTGAMLDARDQWLDAGGRLMYLGGNGFYWVTGVAEDDPSIIEVRRYGGTRTSTGEVGEDTLSVTGERGGLWRDRGRSPQSRVGVGFSGQGFDRGAPYRRTNASFSDQWRWIFHGVDDRVIGAGPALVLGHGAAGFEVDKAAAKYGTPTHAVVLASTERFTDAYQGAIEDMDSAHPWTGGSHEASGVQSDIVFIPGPNGGAVFSAGSITWSSTLSAYSYDGDTSRITQNVLQAFLAERPVWEEAMER